jgi:hypothetical protein
VPAWLALRWALERPFRRLRLPSRAPVVPPRSLPQPNA